MNDKQQLAAMGAELHLTEEQAKALSERMPKTGTLQILNDEPMCMAKRIEELEALLAEKISKVERLKEMNSIALRRIDRMLERDLMVSRLQGLLAEARGMMGNQPRGFGCMIKRIDAILNQDATK